MDTGIQTKQDGDPFSRIRVCNVKNEACIPSHSSGQRANDPIQQAVGTEASRRLFAQEQSSNASYSRLQGSYQGGITIAHTM
jgi:hypothetical protein